MLKRFMFWIILLLLLVILTAFVGVAQTQATELPLLTEPGPYGVRLKIIDFVDPSREDWTLETYVWYPADKTDATPIMTGGLALRDAPPDRSGAPYPLIIYSHVWMSSSAELLRAMEHLASQGYVVAAPQHHDTMPAQFEPVDRPLDILFILDTLAVITDGDLEGMIDTDNVGVMGWSAGGNIALVMVGLLRDPVNLFNWCAEHPELTTWDCARPAEAGNLDFDAIATYRAQLGLQDLPDGSWAPFGDERIHAVLAMAPGGFPLTTEEMLAAVKTPTMILHGTRDQYCDYEGNAVRTYTHLGTDDRYLISIIDQGHSVYSGLQDIPLHFATAFFGDYLQKNEVYAPYLTAENLPTFGRIALAWGPYEGE